MKSWIWGVLLLTALLLAGCADAWVESNYEKTEEGKLFLTVFNAVAQGDKTILKNLPDGVGGQIEASATIKMDQYFDLARDFLSKNRLIFKGFTNWKVDLSPTEGRKSEIMGLFQFVEKPDHWLYLKVKFSGPANNLLVTNIELFPATRKSNESQFPYKLSAISELSYWQLGGVVFAIGVVCICMSAFVLCLFTKNLQHKWLWAILTLFGIAPFSISLDNGDFAFNPLSVVFLAGGISPYLAITGLYFYINDHSSQLPPGITFSIPIGALIFFLRRYLLATGQIR